MKKRLFALLLVGAMAFTTACGSANKQSQTPSASTPSESTSTASSETPAPPAETPAYSEAPSLAGKGLPKVEDRLPVEDDIFVETVDAAGKALEIGTYGDVINLGGTSGSWGIARQALESIIHYNSDGTYYPNVIKSYEFSSDYKVWTFKLRQGMKWSDGDDFNADDITFWYYMCHLNNFDTKKDGWRALLDGKTTDAEGNEQNTYARLEKVDDYTVTWTFENPKFPADFIENGDFKWCWAPSHYLKDLIPDSYYVENPYWEKTGLDDETVLKNAIAKGIDTSSVKDLGKAVSYYWWNEDGIPTINPWSLSTKEGNNSKDAQLCILERNPYFWKVDAQGQQLPYMDEIHYNTTSEDGQDELMFRSGELDLIMVGMENIASLLADLGDKAELRTFASTNWGNTQITFNYTCTDKKYAELFAQSDFRQAISICVDRKEVSGLLSEGFLEPGQCAPAEGNFGYDAEWETKWTEYDVALAKRLLEGCGLVMGKDGFYDFADGTDFVLTIYTYVDSGAAGSSYPVLEKYYKEAGIKCATKDIELTAFDAEIDNNNWYAVLVPHTAIGGSSMKSRPEPFVPIKQAAEWYGEYGTYYADNTKGVKPEGEMAKLVEIYEKWKGTPDPATRDKYNLEIYQVHKANLWTIAYLKAEGTYWLLNSKIKNYPELLVDDDLYQYANLVHYWTLYKAD